VADVQEQNNAVDQEDRTFEVVKLRIAFLQHITTLSGAAILIILALVERAETKRGALLLATTASFFLLAALSAVGGIVALLIRTEYVRLDRARDGSLAILWAATAFIMGIVTVTYFAAGGSFWLYVVITFAVAAIPVSLLLLRRPMSALIRWIMIRFYDYDPDATVRDANEDDAEQP
jgi:hypothetical protein